jgi:hypothetical protein
MRKTFIAALAAMCLSSTVHADPLNLNQNESTFRLGMLALGSTYMLKCTNVSWQQSTNFGKSLVGWTRQVGISDQRAHQITQSMSDKGPWLACDDVPRAMADVSRNWMH